MLGEREIIVWTRDVSFRKRDNRWETRWPSFSGEE
jgi:hypothetical protein